MTLLETPSPFKVVYVEAAGENDFGTAASIPEFASRHTIVLISATADGTQGRNGVVLPELVGDVGTIVELHLAACNPGNSLVRIYDTSGNHIFDLGNSLILKKLVSEPVEYPIASTQRIFVGRWIVYGTTPLNLGVLG